MEFALRPAWGYVPHVALGTQWRGQRDTHGTRFQGLVLLSLILHLPLTPFSALIGLLALLDTEVSDAPDLGELKAIPVELLMGDEDQAPTASVEQPSKPSDEQAATIVPEPAPVPVEEKLPGRDAGLDAGVGPADAGIDAGDASASPEDAGPPPIDGGVPDSGLDAGDAGYNPDAAPPADGGELPDPIALAGEAGSVVDANANVRLRIHNARIRQHALGPTLGALLGRVYQWRDFFAPTGLDAIRDFDEMLVVGPQFRDSSQVAAVMLYRVEDERIREAVDALVRRDTRGHWLDGGVPAAVARADRAERTFVLLPDSDVVMVVPASAAASALAQKSLRFPPTVGDAVAEAYVVSPWRVFLRTGVEVPKSIEWAKVRVSLTPDGGAAADLVLQDESETQAKDNAATLSAAANALTQLNLGVLGALLGAKQHRFVEPITLSVEGSRIVGTVRATPSQLASLLQMAESLFKPEGRRQRMPKPTPPSIAPSSQLSANPIRSMPPGKVAAPDPAKDVAPSALPANRRPATRL